MKKSILNLGAQELSKSEQKNVNGGTIKPNPNTGYVTTLTPGGSIVNQCESFDDCPMQLNPDGSVKSASCIATANGTRCFYMAH